MNNLSYDKDEYENKKTENKRYSDLIFASYIGPSCVPEATGYQKNRETGPRSEYIDIESSLLGFGHPLSKTHPVKPVPVQTTEMEVCKGITQKHERSRQKDNPREKNIYGYFQQILPFDVQKNFRQFNFYNSRQEMKDRKKSLLYKD